MKIDSQNWERLQDLFHLAVATPADRRDLVLSEVCDDPQLRRQVMELVDAAHVEDEPETTPQPTEVNAWIGAYHLVRHLGTGGIGSVYLAERVVGDTVQRSALKILAPHAAGPSFVERFRREQDILASLEHPHITRLLDAGVGDGGQSYLVMEYVNGEHLDAYCDSRQFGIDERLRIFLQICNAVAYAHRNLVVHLDLKPSNILVTQDGVVKLLDFGTSKLIEPDSALTTTIMATPAYASPEQLLNQAVTTSCDIYSLGAILFELLSGCRPSDKVSVAAMIERAMREQEPDRLTTAVTDAAAKSRHVTTARLRAALRGDLENIVAKCLRARSKDRYLSVELLMVDIQRYLEGRPVSARPQTTLYRIGKFVRRNRKAVGATAFAALLLCAMAGFALWRQHQAVEAGRRAIRMQTFVYSLFKLANSNYTGKPAATVPEFLTLGVKVLPQYVTDPTDLRQAQLALAESMYENEDRDDALATFKQVASSAKAGGDINAQAEAEAFAGNIEYLNGNLDEGAALTKDALALSRRSGVTHSARVWSDIYYAWGRDNNGYRTDENLQLMEAALAEARRYDLPAHETADALYNLGQDLDLRGLDDQAEATYREALSLYGDDPSTLCDQADIYGELAWLIDKNGDSAGGAPLFKRAYDDAMKCSGPESERTLGSREFYAMSLLKLGHPQDALAILQTDIPKWRKIEGDTPTFAEPLYYLAEAENDTGHFVEAERDASEMLRVQTGKVAPTDRRFGATNYMLARALIGQNRYADALPHARIANDLLNRNAVSVGGKKAGADAHQQLLDVEAHLGQPQK